MPVIFKSPASGNVIMLDDIAKQLLKYMGASSAIPGAFKAEEIGHAIACLKHNIEKKASTEAVLEQQDFDTEQAISIKTRALPLIELLQEAKKQDSYISWEQ